MGPFLPTPIIPIAEDTKRPQNNKKIPGTIPKYIICMNINTLSFHCFWNDRKDSHRRTMKIRLTKSRKSWIWNQYLPEKMLGTFTDMVPISAHAPTTLGGGKCKPREWGKEWVWGGGRWVGGECREVHEWVGGR